jgi:hypothetical protein
MRKSELEYLANSVKKDLTGMDYGATLNQRPTKYSKFINLLSIAAKELPENKVFIETLLDTCGSLTEYGAKEACDYILELLKLETSSKEKIDEGKIFQGAEDKLKEAGVSFGKDDWPSVINNLNTCIELALKDKLDIPTTITKINTNKIIDICMADGVGPVEHLKEIRKHVLETDNNVKHRGYIPSKKDCIFAIKATQDFIEQAKKRPFEVTVETKEKIYSGL